jgi:hypothetical protein
MQQQPHEQRSPNVQRHWRLQPVDLLFPYVARVGVLLNLNMTPR